jgi:hypothetical protein
LVVSAFLSPALVVVVPAPRRHGHVRIVIRAGEVVVDVAARVVAPQLRAPLPAAFAPVTQHVFVSVTRGVGTVACVNQAPCSQFSRASVGDC